MDFMNRSGQPQPAHQSTPVASTTGTTPLSTIQKKQKVGRESSSNPLMRGGAIALLFAIVILVAAMLGMIIVSNNSNTDQSKFVKQDKYQAVFLTNGQVYFGKLNEIGKDYFQLNNVYYLTQNTTTDTAGNATSNGNYTLVKLGCQQIHDPYDEMVIERNQVSFWENLQDGQYSKVVTSIADYQKQNASKSQADLCATTSTQTQASDTTSTQGGSSTPTGTDSTVKKP
jgi:hypothetical protein